ncbi:MAG: glycosyltransferase family 2 protein, partial [Paracoccaceae bacterium]
ELEDTSALRHAARFDAIHAQAMALPEVARLHHLCCADYAARLAEAAGIAPQADARWRWHMGQAGG